MADMSKENYDIFVVAETSYDDAANILPCSFELLAAARTLCKQAAGTNPRVFAIYLSNLEISPENAAQLFAKGADAIYSIVNPKLDVFNGKYFGKSISELISIKQPKIVLFSATKSGRELAPVVSTTFATGLTADCTSLKIIEENKLVSIRPTFGGKLMAEIMCKTYPQMATLRPGAVKQLDYIYSTSGKIEKFSPNLDNVFSAQTIVEIIKNKDLITDSNLQSAQIVLAGGLGLKSAANFKKLMKIAKLVNSPNLAVAASRGAVEAEFAPKYMQVGQTGISISPKVYIAFGISGAIHHLVGIENAQTIVAVNNDENAPIFSNCNYKIKTDAIELLDEIIEKLEIAQK